MRLLNENWRETLDPLPLEDGDIDLWCVSLDHDQASIVSFFNSLSEDEKHRANRFVYAKDRDYFIASRGTLRRILGGYLGCGPENVGFSYNRFGKPSLAAEGGRLRFNVSHSRGVGVIAVAIDREVGIDIEFVNHDFDVLSVAASAFSAEEAERLRSLPESMRTAAFFAGWTRKEACLKAMGDGLSSSPEQQSAVSGINDEQDVSFTSSAVGKATDWTLTSLKTDDDYKAALAVEGIMGTVRYWRLATDRA